MATGQGLCTLLYKALLTLGEKREVLVLTHGACEVLLRQEILILACSKQLTLVVEDLNGLSEMQSNLDQLPKEYPIVRRRLHEQRGSKRGHRGYPDILVVDLLQYCTIHEVFAHLERFGGINIHLCDYFYPSPQDAPRFHGFLKAWLFARKQVPVMDMIDSIARNRGVTHFSSTLCPPKLGFGTYADLHFSLSPSSSPSSSPSTTLPQTPPSPSGKGNCHSHVDVDGDGDGELFAPAQVREIVDCSSSSFLFE